MATANGILIRFAVQRERNEYRSDTEGRDIFDETEVIFIRALGSKDEVSNIVTDEHRREYADQYKAWKAGQLAPLTGTPLEEWPGTSQSFIDEMRAYGVRTVEQLAELSDGIAGQKPGWLTWRSRAQSWLDQSANQAANAKAEAAEAEAAELRKKVEEMSKMLEALTAPKSKKSAEADAA